MDEPVKLYRCRHCWQEKPKEEFYWRRDYCITYEKYYGDGYHLKIKLCKVCEKKVYDRTRRKPGYHKAARARLVLRERVKKESEVPEQCQREKLASIFMNGRQPVKEPRNKAMRHGFVGFYVGLPPELKKWLDDYVEEIGITYQRFIEDLLKAHRIRVERLAKQLQEDAAAGK